MILDEARMVFPDIPDLLLPPREMFLLSADVLFFHICISVFLPLLQIVILALSDSEADRWRSFFQLARPD